MSERPGFVPPPYPHDRLGALKEVADALPGGVVDCSVGTPVDPMPEAAVACAGGRDAGGHRLPAVDRQPRRSARPRRGGSGAASMSTVAPTAVTRASAPRSSWRRCRTISRCATRRATPCCTPRSRTRRTRWARRSPGCARSPCPSTTHWHLDLDRVDPADAERALVLWLNDPANPTGACATRRRDCRQRRLGTRARHRRRERRVLRRVHLRRAGDPAPPVTALFAAARRRARGALACRSGRTWPGCGPGSSPATPSWSSTSSRSASTPASWCRRPCRPRRRPRWATTRTSTSSGAATRRAGPGSRRCSRTPAWCTTAGRRPSTCGCASDRGEDGWAIAARLARPPACSSRRATSTVPPAPTARAARAQPARRGLDLVIARLASLICAPDRTIRQEHAVADLESRSTPLWEARDDLGAVMPDDRGARRSCTRRSSCSTPARRGWPRSSTARWSCTSG